MTKRAGIVGSGSRAVPQPTAIEVLAGIDKFVTTNRAENRATSPAFDSESIAVDKRVLSIPASPRLINSLNYIKWAVAYSLDDDDTIVSRASKLLIHG